MPEEELDEIAAAKYNRLSEEEKMKWEGGYTTFGPPPTKEASSDDDQNEDSSTSEYVNSVASRTANQTIDLLDRDNSEEDHEKSDGENEDAVQEEGHVEEDELDEEMEGVGEEDVDVVPSTWTQGREVSRRLSHLAIVKGKQGKPFAFALLPYLLSFT